jgi:hypothetical protein
VVGREGVLSLVKARAAKARKAPPAPVAAPAALPRYFADKRVLGTFRSPIDDPGGYGATVDGDCMAPLIRNGDLVVVSPAMAVRKGAIVTITFKNGRKPIVKRLAEDLRKPHPGDEVVFLVAVGMLNPPRRMFIDPAEIDCIHAVAGVMRADEWIPLPEA